MDRPTVAVVMAGGTGTRLYPAARSDRPKQFLSFGGDRSLLERTVDRAGFADEIVVVTRSAFVDGVRERVPDADLLVDPAPKDTGPALVYAAHRIRERLGEVVLVCLPSDHWIAGAFAPTARRAARVAVETGGLVALGVEPDRPATGYGYVAPGDRRGDAYEIDAFREKPGPEAAAAFVDRGWYWNAGIFAWTPDALLRAARDSPLAPLVDALAAGDPDGGFEAIDPASIDRAVLEGAEDAYVVPADFEWDDLGSWDAVGRVFGDHLCDALEIDAADNVLAGDAHVTAVGVENLVVAAYGDRVLVVPADQAQRVREAVGELAERGEF